MAQPPRLHPHTLTYTHTNNTSPNTNRINWNTSHSLCTWIGVTCDVTNTFALSGTILPNTIKLNGNIPPNILTKANMNCDGPGHMKNQRNIQISDHHKNNIYRIAVARNITYESYIWIAALVMSFSMSITFNRLSHSNKK